MSVCWIADRDTRIQMIAELIPVMMLSTTAPATIACASEAFARRLQLVHWQVVGDWASGEVTAVRFDPDSGLIAEIRAYYASPQATGLDRLELAGYPYAERGYAASN